MKYNIAKNALMSVNTTVGNVSITTSGIDAMLNYSNTSIATLSKANSHILVLDCDLGYRTDVYDINYRFRCNTPISTTASGIKFYYKNESFDSYILATTCFSGTEVFYATVSGLSFTPRYVRVTTTMTSISGTTVTGTVHGFEILNNDSVVNFGTDGNTTEKNIFIFTEGDEDISAVSIYNSGVYEADAFVNVEPSFSNIDQVLSISNSIYGPWTYTFDDNSVIADSNNFDCGKFSNTNYDGGTLHIPYILDKDLDYLYRNTDNTYITRVFSLDTYEHSMFILNKITPLLGGKISVNSDDIVDTVEVRYSNYTPAVYSFYRILYTHQPASTKYLSFKDYWTANNTLKQTSTYSCFSFGSTTETVADYYVVVDPKTERWAGFFYVYSPSTIAKWYIFNNVKESSSVSTLMVSHTTSGETMLFEWYNVALDSTGGMWVYFHATSYQYNSATDDLIVQQTGYYLAYFDSTLTVLYSYLMVSNVIRALSVDYDSGFVWYTDKSANTLFKLSRSGIILLSYSKTGYTHALGGVVALNDSIAWFFNDGTLHKISGFSNASVVFLDSIENITDDEFFILEKDGDGSEALWFIEGVYVGRIFVAGDKKGQLDFKVAVDSPVRLLSTNDGCWVWCSSVSGTNIVFVSKLNKRIEKTISSTNIMPGIMEYTYEHDNYADKMPLVIDDNWQNLSWNKVNINTYTLSENKYQQLKLTFRTQTPAERYSGLATNTQFVQNDYFTQANGAPINTQLWGDWTKSINTVNVLTNRLVLPPSSDPLASDPFINTKNRMLIGSDSSNVWDIRINFMFNTGTATGKFEKLYLYVVAYDVGGYGNYIYATYDPGYNTTAYLYVFQNTTSVYTSATYNTTMGWQGVLRLYKDSSNNISAQYDKLYDGTFEKIASLPLTSNYGTYFYVSISSLKAGSSTYIDSFQVVSGNVYYYTEAPTIKSIHTLKPVIVNNISPNSSKEFYIKSKVPNGLDVLSQYETNFNVKWRTPIN